MPSVSPTRNTASHSRPLAACSEARVTPSTVGACWASARSSSSATRSRQGGAGLRGRRSPRRAAPGRPATPSGPGPRPEPAGGSARPAARSRARPAPAAGRSTASSSRRRRRRAGRAAQQQPGLAHLGPLEEPLGAAQLVGHPGVGERLLVDLGLGVDAVTGRRSRCGRHPAVDQLADPAGGALGLGGLVRRTRCRPGSGPGSRCETSSSRCSAAWPAGLGEQPVGQARRPAGWSGSRGPA